MYRLFVQRFISYWAKKLSQ